MSCTSARTKTAERPEPAWHGPEPNLPNHGRLRKLVSRYFTPKAMRDIEARVVEITEALIDEALIDEIELVEGLAKPLPTTVICEMMGVPADDRHTFTRWTTDMTYVLLGDRATPEQKEGPTGALSAMLHRDQ